jgi:hypothetical protein
MKTRLDTRRISSALAGALAVMGALLLADCGPAKRLEKGHTYTVRGQVVELPDPASPGSGLYLQHEAVDNYVDRDGKVVGMDPMAMPFPVAAGVSLQGIAPADIVEFDLHVDWDAEDLPVTITRVRKLPPGTKLVFRAAEPPAQ